MGSRHQTDSESMGTQLLGKTELDERKLQQEIAILKTTNFSDAYTEYAIGTWRTCVLANFSGRAKDGHSMEYPGCAKVTELGHNLPYLISLTRKLFHWKHIK